MSTAVSGKVQGFAVGGFLVTVGASIFVSTLVTGSPLHALGLIVAVPFLAASFAYARLSLLVVLCLYAASMSWVYVQAGLGLDVRFLAVPWVLVLVLRALHVRAPVEIKTPLRFLIAFAVYAGASLLWTSDRASSVEALASLSLLIVLCVSAPRVIRSQDLIRLLAWFTGALVVASIVSYPLTSNSMLTGRFQGLIANPNGLAILVVLAVPLLSIVHPRWRFLFLAVGAVVIFETGSRGAALGLLAVAIILALPLRHRGLRSASLAAIGAAAFLVGRDIAEYVTTQPSSGQGVLRTEHTRQENWTATIEILKGDPLLGAGNGSLPTETGSSYLQLFAENGLVGGVLGLMAIVALLTSVRGAPASVVALVVGPLVGAIFEGWLFVAGSLYCVVFWLAVSTDLGAISRMGGASSTKVDDKHSIRTSG